MEIEILNPLFDSDQTLVEEDGRSSILETKDSDSLPSKLEEADSLCLVPVTVTDYKLPDTMETETEEIGDEVLPVNSFAQFCVCNRFSSPYYKSIGRRTDPCGPWCEYPSQSVYSRRWRNNDDGEEEDTNVYSIREAAATGVGAGLSNLGNTCFLNAILQCFTHTVPFVKAIRSVKHLKPCQRNIDGFCVFCALCDHIELSLASSGKFIWPSKIVDNLKYISSNFEKYQQEDAHEFLQCLLDKLERCLNPKWNGEMSSCQKDNIVERVFGGRLISKLRCCNCGHVSDKYEPVVDLSLEIEEVETLQSALESFTKIEKIEDDLKFTCDRCKEEASIEKQLMLDQAPSVAAFHLKRFKSDGSYIEKIDKHVEIPLELDLKPYTSNQECNESQVDLMYQLYAIVVHIGSLPTSGHYFCYVRSSPSTWHKLDDCKVSRVEEEKVLSQAAYILFYVRDGIPWFSSVMEEQKESLGLNNSKASPKSVLDRIDTESAACPPLENLDHYGTSAAISGSSLAGKDHINKVGNDSGGASAPNCNGSISNGSKPYCNESRGDVSNESRADISQLCCDVSTGNVSIHDISAGVSLNNVSVSLEAKGSNDCLLHTENSSDLLPVEENNSTLNANIIPRNVSDPQTSKPHVNSGKVPDARHSMKRDRPKAEPLVNFKKAKKGISGPQAEALKYISKKMPSSRGGQLMAAMLPRDDNRMLRSSSSFKQAIPTSSH